MLFIIYVAILVYLCIPLIPGMEKLYPQFTEEDRKKRIIAVSTIGAIAGVLIILEVFMKKDIYNDAYDMVSAFILTALAIYLNAKASFYEIFGIVITMTLYLIYNHTNYLKDFRWRQRLPRIPSVQSIVTRRRAQSLPSQPSQLPSDLSSSLPTELTPSTV